MWFAALRASWKSWSSRSRRPQPPARRATSLVLEHLEDRFMPSSYSAASVSDLIADINAANKAGGANTISLTAPTTSPYAITGSSYYANGRNALPVISAGGKRVAAENLTIIGNGDTLSSKGEERFFDVASGASLTLENLTLQGPLPSKGTSVYVPHIIDLYEPWQGGAIYSQGALTLNGTLVEGNLAEGNGAAGGAVYIAGGTANISNVTFSHNLALGAAVAPDLQGYISTSAYGGALYIAAGQVVVTNTAVTTNAAEPAYVSSGYGYGQPGYGDGIYIAQGAGQVVVTNTTVTNNSSEPAYAPVYGGGIYIASGAAVYLDSFTVANTINNTDLSGLNGSTANIDGTYIPT
jgi:hypothetical protein